MKKFILLAVTAIALSACGSTDDLGRGKTGKSITVSGHGYDQIWNASLEAVDKAKGTQALEIDKHLEVTEKSKTDGVIKAETGLSLNSYGEMVGVFISPTTPHAPHYTVEVESLTLMKTNIFANNWEDEIIAAIQQNLQHDKQK